MVDLLAFLLAGRIDGVVVKMERGCIMEWYDMEQNAADRVGATGIWVRKRALLFREWSVVLATLPVLVKVNDG